MAYREIVVFLSKEDESDFISDFSSEIKVTLPYVQPDMQPIEVAFTQELPKSSRSLTDMEPTSYILMSRTFEPRLTLRETHPPLRFVDVSDSELIFLRRTVVGEKLLYGCFGCFFNGFDDSVRAKLQTVWRKIQRWVRKSLVLLPKKDGYASLRILEHAHASGKRLLSFNYVYTVHKSNSEFKFESRLATKKD